MLRHVMPWTPPRRASPRPPHARPRTLPRRPRPPDPACSTGSRRGWSSAAADPDGPWPTGGGTATGADDRGSREEQTVLHARRAELVGVAAAAARPNAAEVPDELADDLGHLVDFLAASVFVDDPSLFEGFVSWVGTVAIPAGLRVDEVGPALDALAAALADSPRTARLLRDARAAHPTPAP